MKILELRPNQPTDSESAFDFASLSNVLFESADLLEEAAASNDEEFKRAAVDLAIRSLYTASTAIDRFVEPPRATQSTYS
jgi:hypothetical protein